MQNPSPISSTLDLKALAGYAVFAAIAGILSLLAGSRSRIDSWAEANPRLAGTLKILRGCGIDPWLIHAGIVLWVRGRLPEELRTELVSKPRHNSLNGAGHGGGTVAAVLMASALTVPHPACSRIENIEWPKVAECAPIPQELASRVLRILFEGTSDGALTEKTLEALEALAREYGETGPEIVICAVQQIVSDLTARVSLNRQEERILRRGRAFLTQTENGGAW